MSARRGPARAGARRSGAPAREGGPGAGAASGAVTSRAGEPALLDVVRRRLAETGAEPTPARVAAALRAHGRLLGDSAVLGVVEALRSEMVGTGPLEPLLTEPDVTDVLVTRPDEVWVDRGRGLERTDVRFPDAASVRRLAQRLATSAGRRLDDARPWVDARLPDGTRLHAVLPPVAVGSTCLSLRVVRHKAFSLDELVGAGTVPPGGESVLRAVLEARLSFLISGGTGSGKTTLLSSLLGLVGPEERIVLAEDSAELRPDHPHVVRLEARPANQEGAGRVALDDLVRQALRMRPDRLVVGEVRGAEVTDLLAALNTGHEGGCGTVHANAAGDVPARLEALGTTAGLDRTALHSQLAAALDVLVHLVRDSSGNRRIAEIHVLSRDAEGLVSTVPALVWGEYGFLEERGAGRLREMCERGMRRPGGVQAGRAHGSGLPSTVGSAFPCTAHEEAAL
ncbi:TadA family conjugal transfer-associated ATPase [Streptomyces sp. WMMB 322]|uniref:TadA family conjugal transfer-associated ATPase n=1 Tax=Streptomyces sp. WMMB 322 TaxID=1286821 RepID=UPI000823CE8E|nr:TadA family conjugal transfer-associated ATPase [Streptomyces sp. WMMB 322]SCK47526.1 pilus assembly protein CpaF [Streptomyces sp. WMMB 322]